MQEVKQVKCSRCKCWREPKVFLNTKGRKLKTCIKCRDYVKILRDKNRCEHKREKRKCKDCGGGCICEHKRERTTCKKCGGGSICEHNRIRSQCKDCGGGSICEHNKIRSKCKDCGGGSICEHNRRKSKCKDCGGSSICEHNKIRSRCKDCDFQGYLGSIVRNRARSALKQKKNKPTLEYLGCSTIKLKEHIEKQFKPGMTWDNYGKWHIDHIIPLKYDKPTLEETCKRLHYLNTQPLWAKDNIAKGNRFIG